VAGSPYLVIFYLYLNSNQNKFQTQKMLYVQSYSPGPAWVENTLMTLSTERRAKMAIM
jgi:hypothetical protein